MYSSKFLHPEQIGQYLSLKQWRIVEEVEGHHQVWTLDDFIDVLLPTDPSFADYALRVSQILADLAFVEKRPQSELVRDIAEKDSTATTQAETNYYKASTVKAEDVEPSTSQSPKRSRSVQGATHGSTVKVLVTTLGIEDPDQPEPETT